MINKIFKENWLKILGFNANRDILEDPKRVEEYLRIPFSPIPINANLLYQFFELLYPRFINDQQNILDIIISDDVKKNMVQRLYLYKTKKAGIHESIELLPYDIIRIKSLEHEKLDELFDKVQKAIIKEKNVRISSIRLFRKECIELMNNYCENIKSVSIYEFLNRILDLLQKIINQDLVIIYPEPIVIHFLRNCLKLLNNIQLQNLFTIIEEVFPEFNLSLLMDGSDIKVIIHLQKKFLKSGRTDLTLKFLTIEELGVNLNNSNLKDNLKLIQKRLNTENTYYVNQNDVISFISDLFELLLPLKKDNILFLLQKVLFAYRSYENNWDMVPRPKIYNTLIRFMVRLFGFNLNLKKLSHWAIPEFISNYVDFYLGLNSKVLFIITDQEQNKYGKKTPNTIYKNSCRYIFLLSFEESTLMSIIKIDKEHLFSGTYNSINSIKEIISEKYGYTSAVIVFDKFLIQNIIRYFFIRHWKFNLFSKLKTLKMLKNNKFFMIYPEFPFYKLIKQKKTIALIKLLLPILIDKHEF
ncbi:MAG: hypothetical protein ACFFDF_16905 [Candidatus Odinarchaeota archaeon]